MALTDLPEVVRTRVVALTADVLPAVPRLPGPLRKVADFAPSRRARLGATQVVAALDGDDDFRERVAVQLSAAAATVGTESGADPVGRASLAWLLRPEDWREQLATALATLSAAAPLEDSDVSGPWETRVRAAEQALRDARARHRAEIADLKAENTQLRRRLGEARSALRDATAAAEQAEAAAADVRREVSAEVTSRDKELRQLRGRLERLEAASQQERRTARADRDEATVRTRLLLDTVLDAAAGLRRELSLPPVPGAPADRVEAALREESADLRGPGLTPVSPGALEQLLGMPRARLLVDGYNVSKSAWPSSSLEAQRVRLVNGLAPLVARTGAETTVVFDAAASTARPVVGSPRGVKVLFSPEGVIADDVIRALVAAEPPGRVVVVVTSDQEVARDAARAGARAVAAATLVDLLARGG